MENEYLQRPIRLTEFQIEQLMVDMGAFRTKRQGNNVQADHCVLHHNSSPTLGMNIDYPHNWNCFSCHKKGPDAVSFVERVKNLTRQEAFSYLVEKFNIDLGDGKFSLTRKIKDDTPPPRFVLSKNALAAYPLSAQSDIGYRAAQHYLGIDRATADKLQLGYRLKDHRLVFPVFHADGELAGLIGRCLLASCTKANRWRNFDAGVFKREYVLMGAHLPIEPGRPLLVVEGPRDYCKLIALGYPNVRAVLGSDTSAWQIQLIASYGVDVVPLYDDDRAGEDGRRALRKSLHGVAHVLGHKFPESAINSEGKGDPAMLTKETLAELVLSFRRGFNFASMSRRAPTPH